MKIIFLDLNKHPQLNVGYTIKPTLLNCLDYTLVTLFDHFLLRDLIRRLTTR